MNSTHKGLVLWFTGLPCSGKTTLSTALVAQLKAEGHAVEHLDGDVIRKKFPQKLGFSREDRAANVTRVAQEALRLMQSNTIVVVSLVSPYRDMRESARRVTGNFIEIYVECPLEVCEQRDTKGMYKLAHAGKIQQFTGVSDPYEPPLNAEITVHTDRKNVGECTRVILEYLKTKPALSR